MGKLFKTCREKFGEYIHDKWAKNFLKKTQQTWQIQTIKRAQSDVKSHQNLKLHQKTTAQPKEKAAALWGGIRATEDQQRLTFIYRTPGVTLTILAITLLGRHYFFPIFPSRKALSSPDWAGSQNSQWIQTHKMQEPSPQLLH